MTSTERRLTLNESIRYKVHALQTLTQKVVHDTNNFYGIIQGYLSLLEMHLANDENLSKYLPPMSEALQAGIKMNQRLAQYHRSSQVLVAETDLVALVREVCDSFAREHDFSVDVTVSGDLVPLPLEEPAIRSLIFSLCLAARETGTVPASMDLALVELAQEDVEPMVLESAPGSYVSLKIALSLATDHQQEKTAFLDPFVLNEDSSQDLGIALLFNTLGNHGGNLDVAAEDQLVTMTLYFPREP